MQPVSGAAARSAIKRWHYSGKVVGNSRLHLGVFWQGRLSGAMQFGPPMVKRNVLGLVEGTGWSGMLELNRLAFSDELPRNSESRALGVAFRMIRRQYPHVGWILSYADGTRSGDGTIYRACGFVLTGIKKNTTIIRLPDGSVGADITYHLGKHIVAQQGRAGIPPGSKALPGFQLRYIKFLDPALRDKLTVPVLEYDEIEARGAGMYLGRAK